MNIWLVTIGEPLPVDSESKKLRTGMLAECLAARGHSVLLFASAFNHLKKQWAYEKERQVKLSENYEMKVLKGTGYKKNISLKRFIDHRIIAKKFSKLAPTLPKPDIIIASLPPHDLTYHAGRFASQNKIPLLIDIRDPWPDILLQKAPVLFSGLLRKILFREFYFARAAMRYADGLIATTSTLLDWGLKYAGRKKTDADRVIYLAQKVYKLSGSPKSIPSGDIENKFNVIFIGTFAHYHNPLILARAARKLVSETGIHFIIAGSGQLKAELEKEAAGLPNITLTGWLNETEINFWLSKSKVGICPTPLYIDILPNKAGTYLSAGLPVISAFQGDLKDMMEEQNIGLYYPPNDANALAQCILKIYRDQKRYEQMSANAKKLFEEKFNADKTYEDYANHIEMIKANYSKG
jgi:glycosyltransferase involved in cell wall biosynthesis